MNPNLTEDMTRVDLERQHNNVLVSIWKKGWKTNSAPALYDYLPDTRLEDVLAHCEELGFTVHMIDNNTGRALRGEITRVDILEIGQSEWEVSKYPFGWTASTRPIEKKTMTKEQAEDAINWCETHGWTVRKFPGGARAWKGAALPIRDRRSILALHRQRQSNMQKGGDPRFQFDFAFDC